AAEAPGREGVETASIVEALEHLPPAHYSPKGSGNHLSEDARLRLGRLAGKLRAIRDFTYLPLPDLLAAAEHTLGLDIEVLAHRPEHTARHNLDEFAAVAASFTSGVDEANLGGFLAWLDAAEEHERGLSLAEVEPDPAAVQLMTIHAAKGREWEAGLIEVLAHRPEHTARHNLDEFAAVAASFTSGVDEANLGGFLAWLDAAEEHERGLSLAEVEPDPAAVQLMTIHAAKGLEWEAVIV